MITPATIIEQLKAAQPESVLGVEEFRGETTIRVKTGDIVPICTFLRNLEDSPFDYLVDVCGADAYTPENRFEVIYNIYSLRTKIRLRLKIAAEDGTPHVPSVTAVWPGAEWPERETYDMFGIVFDGHPDLRRIYMPEEFGYYPLRKDFPLMGIPGTMPLPRK
jgi:NADH-quinone oxidoreductase subunit C